MSLIAEARDVQSESTTAPLRIVARAKVGETVYVIGTRTDNAALALYVERTDKEGAVKHRATSKLADIAHAMDADFTDTDGESIDVF